MTSTKALKEKSSTPKFWKKFSLNKNKSPSSADVAPEHHEVVVDDDKSVKSKRLSGFFPHKRQSSYSLRKRQSIQSHPPIPDYTQQPSPSVENSRDQPGIAAVHVAPIPSSTTTATAAGGPLPTAVDKPATNEKEGVPSKTDDSPNLSRSADHPVQSADPEPGKNQDDNDQSQTAGSIDNKSTPLEKDNNTVPKSKTTESRIVRPRYNSNAAAKTSGIPTTSRLVTHGSIAVKSNNNTPASSFDNKPTLSTSTTSTRGATNTDRLPRPSSNKSTQSQRSTPSSSTSTTRSASASTSSSSSVSHSVKEQTRLRKPSQIPGSMNNAPKKSKSEVSSNGSVSKKKSEANLSSRGNKGSTTKEDISNSSVKSDEGDLMATIQQLKEELQKERSIVLVLQRQKEAVAKDLDYFSQMMDELMEEKEALQQKYEEEKEKNKHREEDLNVLLQKLRSSNDNARDRSLEAEQWRQDLENIREEARKEQEELRSQLSEKNTEIRRLKAELSQAQDEIKSLKSRMEQLVKSQSSLSSEKNVQDDNDPQSSIPGAHETSLPPTPTSRHHSSTTNENTPSNTVSSSYTEYDITASKSDGYASLSGTSHSSEASEQREDKLSEQDDLDRQLLRLTKEKEKLQSDYSKIPLSGGGPMSRRRKEELEEMLDEVDSQLSRVKQKIRRS